MDGSIGRRTFLKALAAGTATLVGARTNTAAVRAALDAPEGASRRSGASFGKPSPAPSGSDSLAVPKVVGRIRAPGDVIAVEWPVGQDRAHARFVHQVDGRTVAVAPVPPPTAGSSPRVRFVAEPAGGLLSGVHEFALEVSGSREDLGGFRVTPFDFGC